MAVTVGGRSCRSGPVDEPDCDGTRHRSITAATSARAKPGDLILRTTASSDDLTADLLRFGAGFVTLILAIVLGLGT